MKTTETLSGFVPTRSLVSTKEIHLRGLKGSVKDKQPYKADSTRSRPYKEKSKSKDRKKDYSDARRRKRGENSYD